jgi:hypothetical protein
VLSESRAARLAFLAERTVAHHPGNEVRRPGWRARRAWQILRNAADAGDQKAIEAVWRAWLRYRDEERWELLSRWRIPQDLAEAVLAAAVEPYRNAAARAALGEFCARHDLVPDDPVRRVLFFTMTGQHAQHRAADPDGSLLATAYQAADRPARGALRKALAGAGDLDVVRVIAGAGSRVADMRAEERDYLVGQLAGRRDWPGLWRLARDLPVVEAVAALWLIDERWRPDRQHDRDLFGLLSGIGGDVVRAAGGALTAGGAIRIEVPSRVVGRCSLARCPAGRGDHGRL